MAQFHDSGLFVPPGYINPNVSVYYQKPSVTGLPQITNEIYVSSEGSDEPGNNGTITLPFKTILTALKYR